MDAIEMLTNDHTTVRSLFEAFRTADEGAAAPAPAYGSTGREMAAERPVVAQLCDELELHTLIEEQLFYPAVKALNDDALNDQVARALDDHAVVKEEVAALRAMSGALVDIAARIERLEKDVDQHATEEEQQMFPRVAELMSSSRREALARDMEERKRGTPALEAAP